MFCCSKTSSAYELRISEWSADVCSSDLLGIRHETVGDPIAFGHSGSMWGFRSYSLTAPASGVGVAVFGNRSDLDPGHLAWRAYHLATGDSRLRSEERRVGKAWGSTARSRQSPDNYTNRRHSTKPY